MDFGDSTRHPTASLGIYALGKLSATEERAIRRHLEVCAGCRVEVDDLEGMAELLAAATLVPPLPARVAAIALSQLPDRRPLGPATPGSTARAEGGTQPTANGSSATANGSSAVTSQPGPGLQVPAGSSTAFGLRADVAEAREARPPPPTCSPRDKPRPEPPGSLIMAPVRPHCAGKHSLSYLVVFVAGALVATAVLILLALLRDNGGKAVELHPQPGATGAGQVVVDGTATGLELTLRISGLEPGMYVVTVETGNGPLAAGSFRVGRDGEAEAELHTGASAGHIIVASADDPETPLLRGTLPD